MAIKRFCDRCDTEINSSSCVTYIKAETMEYGIYCGYGVGVKDKGSYELCESCANELKLWLNEKKRENDE